MTIGDWTAAGALATACAAGIALATIVVMWQQAIEAEAARLREALRGVVSTTARVNNQMRDGSALVVAGWLIAEGLRKRYPDADLAALEDSEGKDWALSAVLEGWSSSPLAADLRHSLASLATEKEKLPGHLAVLGKTATLLEHIASDAYSMDQFMMLLSPDALDLFAAHYPTKSDDSALRTRHLATYLGSNASLYVVTRYFDAFVLLDALMEELCSAFAEMSARRLVKHARARRLPQAEQLITDSIRNELDMLGLAEALRTRLVEHLDELAQLMTRESAATRLAASRTG